MIRTPSELFAHRLRTMLWVEQTLATRILPALRDHAHASGLRHGLERHLLETEQHVRTLENALHLLGTGAARPEESPALLGLEAEHEALLQAVEPECHDVADLMHADAVAQVEHLEIAAYESLVATAHALGEGEIAALLRELLEQEQYALELAEKASTRLLAERVESRRL